MTQHEKYIEGTRQRLEEAALNYARMKTMGLHLENGCLCVVSGSDRQNYVDMFLRNLLVEAEHLLAELTMTPLPSRKTDNG